MKRNFSLFAAEPEMQKAARIAVNTSLQVKPEERVLIISNPGGEAALIAEALYNAALEAGGRPALIFQDVKTQLDFADDAVIAAFAANPQVVISVSTEKLGKDREAMAAPYEYQGGRFDHVFHLQLYGRKSCRAFWSPGVTRDTFLRTVPIDYGTLKERCAALARALDAARAVRITAPGGTDLYIGLARRRGRVDDGDFSQPGAGGNLPAGETFISPENGTARGVIVFDGSISLHQGDLVIREPIRCGVEKGFVTTISGGEEARALERTIELAQEEAHKKLPAEEAETYARNARNIGEFGIGLNPAAQITGNMLEDEKVLNTCHFAIGQNYDEDAPALIHLDGLVKNPVITAAGEDGVFREIFYF